MQKFLILLVAAILPTSLWAQEESDPVPAIAYTTEGLWNTTTGIANWVNILNVEYDFPLWRNGTFSLDLLAVNNLRHEQDKGGVADNLHLFSAIEDAPSTLALMAFGVGQRFFDNELLLYLGIRNLGKDYFTSPWNSVFTSAMNGLFPSIATNFVVPDAPLAAMSLHAEWHPEERWCAKLSLYDGVASDQWGELFRLNLGRDGIFTIGEVSYKGNGGGFVGSYHLGATFGYAPTATTLARGGSHKSRRASLWMLAEQPLYRNQQGRELCLIVHGAWAPQSDCDLYGAGGIVCRSLFTRGDYIGLLVNRGLYRGGYETQLEVTYSYEWRYLRLQPALHRIHASRHDYTVAMFKVVVEI